LTGATLMFEILCILSELIEPSMNG
jgi:hypothetical protein